MRPRRPIAAVLQAEARKVARVDVDANHGSQIPFYGDPGAPSVCIHQSPLSLFHPCTRAATASAFCSLSFNSQNCPLSGVTQHPLLPPRYANRRCRRQESQ